MSLLGRSSRRFLLRHPGQLALTVLGVALGVAVVVSIDLAILSSRAAFAASTETVAGRATHAIEGGPAGLPASTLARIRTEAGLRASAPVVEAYGMSTALPGRALRVLGIDPFSERPFRPWLGGGARAELGEGAAVGTASEEGEAGGGGGSEAVEGAAGLADPAGDRRSGAGRGSGAVELDITRLLTEPGAVLVAASVADEAGWAVGDSLPLMVEGRRADAVLVGLLRPDDDLARQGLRDLVLTDIATAQRFLGRAALTRIELLVPEGPRGDQMLARVGGLLPAGAEIRPVGARADDLVGMLRAFDLNLTALSLLALVFGMFLIYNAMTFSVVQRRELLGGLRAIGVTRREIFRMVTSEAVWTGLAGTALGLGAGVVLGQGLVGLVTRTINDLYFVLAVEGITVTPALLLKGGALGMGSTLLAALPAIREAVAAPPRASMVRSLGEERVTRQVPRIGVAGALILVGGGALLLLPTRSVGVGFAGLALVVVGIAALAPIATVGMVRLLTPLLSRTVGILGTMAARGVVSALSRTAPAVASLVVAVSVTVGLGVMISSFRSTLVTWLDYTLQADVYISPPSAVASRADGTLPPDLIQRLRATEGVDGVSTYRGEIVPSQYGELRLVALDLDPRGEPAFRFRTEDRDEAFRRFRAGEAVFASEPFAYRHGLSVGDSVAIPGATITTPATAPIPPTGATGAGAAVRLPIAAVFTDFGSDQGVVMMGRAAWDRFFDDPGVTSLGMFVQDGVDPDAMVARLEARVDPDGSRGQTAVIRSNRTLRSESLIVFDRTFAITAVLRALAFVVAFIGVLSALMALQLERGRELGVLRANGMTPRQVWGLVTAQTGVMGAVAGVLAIPAGLILAVVMIFVVNKRSFGWTLQMEVGPEVLIQSVLLAVVGALVAGLWPAWRMSRTSPAVALREE